jgi:hypothetical protein
MVDAGAACVEAVRRRRGREEVAQGRNREIEVRDDDNDDEIPEMRQRLGGITAEADRTTTLPAPPMPLDKAKRAPPLAPHASAPLRSIGKDGSLLARSGRNLRPSAVSNSWNISECLCDNRCSARQRRGTLQTNIFFLCAVCTELSWHDLLGGVRVVTLSLHGEFLQLYQYGLRLVVLVLVCGEWLNRWCSLHVLSVLDGTATDWTHSQPVRGTKAIADC